MADTSDNYLGWDDTEPVTFTSRSGNRSVNVSHGKRTAIRRREAVAMGIALNPNVTQWSLPVALMKGLVPAEGDSIRDSEEAEWIIGPEIELLGVSSRYRVIATRSV